jgi:hypothetical protein
MTLMVLNAILYGALLLFGITIGAYAYRVGRMRAVYGLSALFVVLQIVITAIRAALP